MVPIDLGNSELFGPRRFGDATDAMKVLWSLWPFRDCTKRGDKRLCHQTDEVQLFWDNLVEHSNPPLLF